MHLKYSFVRNVSSVSITEEGLLLSPALTTPYDCSDCSSLLLWLLHMIAPLSCSDGTIWLLLFLLAKFQLLPGSFEKSHWGDTVRPRHVRLGQREPGQSHQQLAVFMVFRKFRRVPCHIVKEYTSQCYVTESTLCNVTMQNAQVFSV